MTAPLFSSLPQILAVHLNHLDPQFTFPRGPVNELIFLRWIHFVSGIIWIGLLYFFNLVGFATLNELDPPVRSKVFPVLMSRAMSWFRWSALITVLVGLRYFFTILAADAQNSGNPSLALRWFLEWFLLWLVAYALIYPLQLPAKGALNIPAVRIVGIGAIVIAASYLSLVLSAGPAISNAHLSIGIGGGLGFLMLLNTWGVVWRAQKRLIQWSRAANENGTPMPPEADRLRRWAFLASRVGFWLSIPMLFFMGAAEHYPFLSNIAK
ncbi:MAG TPA: hypothetical protein VGD60_17795 [Candidatus Acidoferrales bacterium]